MMFNVEPNVMLKLNGLKDMKVQPFNEKQMMKDLNEQLKNLKVKPFDEKQMKELNEHMKELKMMPVAPDASRGSASSRCRDGAVRARSSCGPAAQLASRLPGNRMGSDVAPV